MDDRVVVCAYCSSELFDEDEALIECMKVYIHNSTSEYHMYWIDAINRVRCKSCDTVIGEQIRIGNDSFYALVWGCRVESEETNENEMQYASYFLTCFAQVEFS